MSEMSFPSQEQQATPNFNALNFMYQIRKALPSDLPFLIECVLQAESLSGKSTYETLLNFNATQTTNLLKSIFEEEIEDQEVCVHSFAVVTYRGEPVAGCAAWIECLNGTPSNTLKATALHFLTQQNFQNNPFFHALADVNIPRTPMTIQLESFYTHPEFRGKNLAQLLIEFHLFYLQSPEIKFAEIQTVNENLPAIKAYQKAGFSMYQQTSSTDPLVYQLLGGSGKTLLQKSI